MLKLYNTATRQKEEFKPLTPGLVKLYTCGPTVYNHAHIGNFRTYIFEDLLRRTIQFFDFTIEHVMNITDVEDKTIKGAIENKVSLDDYTRPFKEAFFTDLDTLNIQRAEHYPEATSYIPQMIQMIEELVKKEIAYQGADGSIYYAIHKFPHYGCLSHLKLDELKVGASKRIGNDEYDKENIADFVLWKSYVPERDGDIYWESPFGKGRPGWHLECSTMAIQILGETIDIHVGGIDNMFPHHENEIAQSEACTGKTFANLWMHSEHLIVENKKMSKSLGNFFTLRDLLEKGYTGKQVRYLLLQTHYKTQLNFTFAGLEAAKHSLHRLNDFINRIQQIENEETNSNIDTILDKSMQEFADALADDLNISVALAAIFDMIREINTLCDKNFVGKNSAEKVISAMKKVDSILGVLEFDDAEVVPEELLKALQERNKARDEKNWNEADRLRDFIKSKGFLIKDTKKGSTLKREML